MPALLSFIFVLIWSTGFVVARAVLPYAAPQLFLVLRMSLTALVLAGVTILRRDPWPTGQRIWFHLITGALLNGVYLCFAYTAIWRGMPAGVMALLSSAQPIGIAVWAYFFRNERLPKSGVFGLVLAVLGVIFVVQPALASGRGGHVDEMGLAAAVIAVISMAIATTIQRSALSSDSLSVAASLQNAGGIPIALAAMLLEGNYLWDGSLVLWGSLVWSVIGLSAAGVSLVVWLSRHNGPTKMSALLLAVPPLAALEAYAFFGERLVPLQIGGFVLAIIGVFLTRAPAGSVGASLDQVIRLVARRSA